MALNIQNNDTVLFVYAPTESLLPAVPDAATVYFVEDTQKLYVGSHLIADHIDVDTAISTALEDYQVKSVTISGSGNNIAGASFDSSTGALTLTKGSLGTAAAEDVEAFMAASNGTATGASVTLASDPSTAMEAATKQYVDSAVAGLSGAMHFKGTTTTAVSDGGNETATIGGQTLTAEAGDVVLYQGKEFVWTGSAWEELGDEGSFALKTTQVSAGTGLTGGGALTSDITLNHQAKPATGTAEISSPTVSDAQIDVLTNITTDDLGHIVSATSTDIYTHVSNIADAAGAAAAADALDGLDLAQVGGTGYYISTISQADGQVSATAAQLPDTTLKWTVLS